MKHSALAGSPSVLLAAALALMLGILAFPCQAEPFERLEAWAAEAFAGPAAGAVDSHIVIEHRRNHVVRNRTPWGTRLTLAGKEYEHGVYMDSAAAIRVVVGQEAEAFVADAGIDDNEDARANPDRGSARFSVEVHGEKRYASPVLRLSDGGVAVRAPLEGATEFTLAVDDAGDGIGWDQCVWGDAAVVMKDGSKHFLDEMPWTEAGETRDMPPAFSFTYGGAPSDRAMGTWEYAKAERQLTGKHVCTHTYRDPQTGLRVDCEVTRFDGIPAVDWVCYLANEGKEDTPIIEQFMPLDAPLLSGVAEGGMMLRWSEGDANSEDAFLPHDVRLEADKPRRFTPDGGRSSNGTFPFFNLAGPEGGWVVAIGWTGQWLAEFCHTGDGRAHVKAGMEETCFRLHPGERVRTPRIALLRWEGTDMLAGHNAFRQLMLRHYVQQQEGGPALPPIAHNTAATIYQTGQPTNEANQLTMVEQTAARGCEAFWLDAYWYPQPWHRHVGDWFPRPGDFPKGLKPIADRVHEKGLDFVLWFEPERVAEGTQWAKREADLIALGDNSNRLLNLARPETLAFVTDFVAERIAEWDVDMYRQDFNFDPLPYWREADSEGRQGITEMKYVEGLYTFWDDLRARKPGLLIDNCASGGRRIDLETCMRSWPLWRSDRNDIGEGLKGEGYWPYMGQADHVHAAGLWLYIPFHTGPVWSAQPYVWRSAMSAGIGLYGNIENFDADLTREAIAELRSLRPLFLGDFYPLTAITTSQREWHAYQFDRVDLGQGFALFFRRPESPYPECEVALRGLDAEAAYAVSLTGETYTEGPRVEMKGSELAHPLVRIETQPGSLLLRYTKLD